MLHGRGSSRLETEQYVIGGLSHTGDKSEQVGVIV